MAEKFVLGVAQSVLGILGTYAGDRITSASIANEELKKLERSLNLICPFIREAENKLSSSTSSTEQGNEGIKKWLMELKNVIYDIEDVLDEAATDALRLEVMKEGGRKKLYNKVRYHLSSLKHKFLSPFSLSDKIKDLRGRLDQIAADVKGLGINIDSHINPLASHGSEDRIRIPLPFINKADNILGRDEVKREIKGMVLGNGVEYSRGLSALAIVGVGGIGKTTVAQMIYADLEIDSNFDIKLWGCISKPFNFKMVLKRILGSIDISIGSDDIGQMVNALASAVRDKRYFLILDDVWTEDTEEWKQLRDVLAYGGKEESVILVTTRNEKVAKTAIGTRQIFNLAELSFDVCMSIFTGNAFEEGESERYPGLVEVGKIIVGNCKGLPLAVQAVGSMLRGERDEREWHRIAENDLWKQKGVLAALRLSYNDLPCHLKLCFAYLSIYPKGVTLNANDVVYMLAAQGLITDKDNVDGEEWKETGKRYMKELLSRSLLQEPDLFFDGELCSFKMHDLVHDLALDVMGEELATMTDSNDHRKVSSFVRHISWDREHVPSKEEIPRELLLQAHQVRTLYFPYKMTLTDKMFIQQVVSSFKCLRSLSLAGTDIEELPDSIGDLKHLRHLDLFYNVLLKSIPNSICKLLNLQTLDLRGCEQLEKLPKDIGNLINLTQLDITLSSQSKYLIPKRMKVIRSSLRHLTIYKCSELISLLEEEEKDDVSKNIIFLTELRILEIADCPKFSPHLSNSLRYLTSLNKLIIKVSEVVDGHMELLPQPTATVGGMKLDGLRSLTCLLINGLQSMVGLPDVLQTAATSLRHLHLWNCARLKSLPEWLRNFKSLSRLFIINCPELSTLPSDGFLGLTSVQAICVKRCPRLSLRCLYSGWDYWPRNSYIEFDGERINFRGEYVEDSEGRKN